MSAGPRLFLSHASDDKDDVQKLRKALADRGIAAWEDVLELRLGAGLDALKDAIQGAEGFVLYLTPASIGSRWVQREAGWAREAKSLLPEYAILPILRGLDRPALDLLFPDIEPVSIVLAPDEPIEQAVPAIVQALGALEAISAGNRDPALADDPALYPTGAVELALLLESLPPAAHLAAGALCPCGSDKPFRLCHGAA